MAWAIAAQGRVQTPLERVYPESQEVHTVLLQNRQLARLVGAFGQLDVHEVLPAFRVNPEIHAEQVDTVKHVEQY